MNNRDWEFAFGDFGDPLKDVDEFLSNPHEKFHKDWIEGKERIYVEDE